MVFAPASVLAAMPLQLCLGSDGHRTLESALSGDHHSDAFHSDSARADQTPNGDYVATENRSDCNDVALQAVGQLSSRSTAVLGKADSSKIFDTALPAYPQPIILAAPCDSGVRAQHAQGAVLSDPHLASLATIVLLN
ncbi:MAG: hypothetical protein ACKVP4_05400 [Hyphomicrobium sp.]